MRAKAEHVATTCAWNSSWRCRLFLAVLPQKCQEALASPVKVLSRLGGTVEEEEEEFFNHYKNDLKRHAHTPSGVAGADLKS